LANTHPTTITVTITDAGTTVTIGDEQTPHTITHVTGKPALTKPMIWQLGTALTVNQWARIIANAWLDSAFKSLLERDPLQAVNQAAKSLRSFTIAPNAKLCDLGPISTGQDQSMYAASPTEGLPTYETNSGDKFTGYDEQQLTELIQTGDLAGQSIQLEYGQWISPMNVVTTFPPAMNLSMEDWVKIYAYVWLEVGRGNTDFKSQFERDPARGTWDVVGSLLKDYGVYINYVYGRTPLFNIGPAPTEAHLDLATIANDPATKARFLLRLCC
jgi:hypothetical protein